MRPQNYTPIWARYKLALFVSESGIIIFEVLYLLVNLG